MSYVYLVSIPGSTRASVTADLVQIHPDGSLAFYKNPSQQEQDLNIDKLQRQGPRLVRAWGAGRWIEMEEHESASAGTTALHKPEAS